MNIKLITPSTVNPVSINEAISHLRLDNNCEQDLINTYIQAAVDYAESYLNKDITLKTWQESYKCFPTTFELQKADVQSVLSIEYLDTDGVNTVLPTSEYIVSAGDQPTLIVPDYNITWPTARNIMDSVRVQYTSGYATKELIPPSIKSAILLITGHLFLNRENSSVLTMKEIPLSAEYLLNPFRLFWEQE